MSREHIKQTIMIHELRLTFAQRIARDLESLYPQEHSEEIASASGRDRGAESFRRTMGLRSRRARSKLRKSDSAEITPFRSGPPSSSWGNLEEEDA